MSPVQASHGQWPESDQVDGRVVKAIIAADIEHVEELIEAYSIEAGAAARCRPGVHDNCSCIPQAPGV